MSARRFLPASGRASSLVVLLVVLCISGRTSGRQPATADGRGGRACPGDVNGDGVVDAVDLAIVLGNWGPCPAEPVCGNSIIEPGEQCDPPDGLTCSDQCQLLCSLEGEEDCGMPEDVVNGGCGSNPIVFSSMSCAEVYCSTAAWDGVTRDTDWYEVQVTEPTQVVWTVSAEFPALIGVVDTGGSGDCFDAQGLDPFAIGPAGDALSVLACLSPGTWWLYVAPDFDGPPFECGAGYVAHLSCLEPCDGP